MRLVTLSVGAERTLCVFSGKRQLTHNDVVGRQVVSARVSAGKGRYISVEIGELCRSFCLSRHLQSLYLRELADTGYISLCQADMVAVSEDLVIVSQTARHSHYSLYGQRFVVTSPSHQWWCINSFTGTGTGSGQHAPA